MSEIRITYNSIDNANLKYGQFVFGNCKDYGEITSSSIGAFAHGYTNIGFIQANEAGSYASGYSEEFSAYTGSIVSNKKASFAHGYAKGGSIESNGIGAHAEGCVQPSVAYEERYFGKIDASGDGAHAEGCAVGGSILAQNNGAYAIGCVQYDSTIGAYSAGSYAKGYTQKGEIIANNFGASAEGCAIGNHDGRAGILSSGSGSHAEGYASPGQIIAEGNGAHAEGYVRDKNDIILAKGYGSHAEGINTCALSTASHAEGINTYALGEASHTEGYGSKQRKTITVTSSYKDGRNVTANLQRYSLVYTPISLVTQLPEFNDYCVGCYCIFESGEFAIIENIALFNNQLILAFNKSSIRGGTRNIAGQQIQIYYPPYAIGKASHAEGTETIAYNDNMFVTGKYNKYVSNEDMFVIGNGANTETPRNALYVQSATSSLTDTSNCIMHINGTLEVTQAASFNTLSVIDDISCNTIHVVSGAYQTSDITKKNVILDDISIDTAYNMLEKCHTILYTLKDDESKKEQIGMIAQEIKEYFPEIVNESEDGTLSLDYSRLSVILFRLVKDLSERNNELHKRISIIEEKLSKL